MVFPRKGVVIDEINTVKKIIEKIFDPTTSDTQREFLNSVYESHIKNINENGLVFDEALLRDGTWIRTRDLDTKKLILPKQVG